MPADHRAVLSALATLHDATGMSPLPAAPVNALFDALGLSAEAAAREMDRAAEHRWVTLGWGGFVTLTPEGRAEAAGRVAPSGGTTIITHGIATVAVGNNNTQSIHAQGGGAVHTESPPLADLAALVAALRTLSAPEPVTAEAEAALAAAKAPKPDKATIAQRLTGVRDGLLALGQIGEAGAKLAPLAEKAGDLLGKLLP